MKALRALSVSSAIAAVAAVMVASPIPVAAQGAPSPAAAPRIVHVDGNRLVDAAGQPVQLVGLNRSGSEYACVQGWGFFDGPVDAASITAMTTWHPNIVRVPLNDDCWLGVNGVSPAYSGTAYRQAIRGYAHRLEAQGLLVDLELHWNAPGANLANGQQVMADADHAPAFWRSVAFAYKGDPAVLFELYNEPHDISWSCWQHGCTTSAGWRAAGMQHLVNAVRRTGATNVVLAGGLGYSSDLSSWLSHRPDDPAHQLAAAFHTYNFSGCNTAACWDATIARVNRQVPVVTTEFGENDCAGGYVDSYLDWADAHHVGYLAWTWDTWDCASGPALITSYDGTPTGYGSAVRTHYLSQSLARPSQRG